MNNLRPYFFFFLFCVFTTIEALEEKACQEYDNREISWIKYEGLKNTRPYVVKRELIHRTDSVFNCADWAAERKKLESLDIFALIDLKIDDRENSLGLIYKFVELPLFFPVIDGKKTDQNGLIAGPAAATLNLFGRDLRIEVHMRTSVEDFGAANEFLASVNSYWLGNLPVEYWAGFAYTDSYNPFVVFPADSLNGFPEVSQIFSLEMQQRMSGFWSIKYLTNYFSISTDKKYREKVLLSSDRDNVARAGLGIVRDSRETRFNPHKGHYTEFLLAYSGGDANFTEWLGDWRGYIPIGKKHIVHLSLLGQYRNGKIGVYDMFFVGGMNTLRGYDPVNDGLSGTSEILSLIEYRYEFFGKKNFRIFGLPWFYGLQAVAGFDMAYTWMDDYIADGLEGRSIYIGAHILMPGIDRIRLELGNKAMKFEFDMGFGFGLFERSVVQRWRIR